MKRVLILAMLLIAQFPPGARADGFIIPRPPHPGGPYPPNLSIRYHHVEITIDEQVARTTVDQVFVNNYHRDIEGTYIFPVPPGASISDFSLYVGGEEIKGKLLDRAEARRIYEDIVRSRRDPALLEYFGEGMFKASVYPIPARGESRIKLHYAEVLKLEGGVCRYRYTLGTEKFSRDPLESVRVGVEIRSKRPIKNIYSPSHAITIERDGDHRARVTYAEEKSRPDTDFLLYYTVSEDEIGFDLLAFEEGGRGYFLAMISPPAEAPPGGPAGKDVIFILDSSGSMQGEKMRQARGALAFCLNGLNEGDRFNVIDFDDDVEPFEEGLVRADRRNVAEAVSFTERCDAEGGTNIRDALIAGLGQIGRSGRTPFVIFLTDGLPTVGERDIRRILDDVKEANRSGARIFVFGVGYDVNTRLLDGLARENRASADYVRPSEDIEVTVSAFFRKVSYPILTDIEIDFGEIAVREVYPRELPDIFKGSQLLVLGRYDGGGRTRVTLTGSSRGTTRRYEYRADFTPDRRCDFIPRLWATRRIGYLIEELRLHGNDRELVGEIVRLSKRYGIITEYTSFLVDADYRLAARELDGEAEKMLAPAVKEVVGGAAVNRAKSSLALKSGVVAPRDFADSEGDLHRVSAVVHAGARTFFNKQGLWVDSEYEGAGEPVKVKRYSDAYFTLLRAVPEAGRFLALGDEVIFLLNGTAVHVSDEGAERFTDAELEALAGR